MPTAMRLLCAAAMLALAAPPLAAKPKTAQPPAPAEFAYDEKVNEQMAKRLNIPVYFAVPASARATLPKTLKTTDKLIDFKHPDAKGAPGDVGLRLVVTKRSGMTQRLGKSGLVETGDILLSFRSEWGGAGAYPNVQMGVTHAGVAYVKDGELRNLDNPMDTEFLGSRLRGDFSGEHYKSIKFIHVVRPRNLTDAERANILAWATRLNGRAAKVYPSQIAFNQDYNAPKFRDGKPLDFVKRFGEIALGQNPAGTIDMFCSEFAWSLLALRNCDPAKEGDAFKGSRVPACVNPIMKPMEVTGNYVMNHKRTSYSGLADGPLLVIDAMKRPKAEQDALIKTVFVENPAGLAKLSAGHKKVAEDMQSKFAPLEQYYRGSLGGVWQGLKARYISMRFRRAVPENYSPTSYLINTLLPPDNANRTMDYVATIVIE